MSDARKAELEAMSEHDRRVAMINDAKTKRTKENMQKAHEKQMVRRRQEEMQIKQIEYAFFSFVLFVIHHADIRGERGRATSLE